MITIDGFETVQLVIGGKYHGTPAGHPLPDDFDENEYYWFGLEFLRDGKLVFSGFFLHESFDKASRSLALMSIPLSPEVYAKISEVISAWENS